LMIRSAANDLLPMPTPFLNLQSNIKTGLVLGGQVKVLSERFIYKLFANIFANELFVTIIAKVVLVSTT
jgi:hypothetical protein